jgi:hypothetical protein
VAESTKSDRSNTDLMKREKREKEIEIEKRNKEVNSFFIHCFFYCCILFSNIYL